MFIFNKTSVIGKYIVKYTKLGGMFSPIVTTIFKQWKFEILALCVGWLKLYLNLTVYKWCCSLYLKELE